jgi:UDP-glucose 4-epimerase
LNKALEGKKVVVTGGAGFIGSELVRQLDTAGAHVVVVDNLVNGKRGNIAGLSARVALVQADIRDRDEMARQLTDAAVVFHLACLGVRHSIHSPEENHSVNAHGTLLLLQEARKAKAGRFVYVSSSEVYGTARTVPMDEDHTTYPMTVYGGGKLAGEAYARAFKLTYGYPTVIVRPFNAFGPRSHHEGDSGEVIPRFMLRMMAGLPAIIFGDGGHTRDLTFVGDTARGILAAGVTGGVLGETINIGSGVPLKIKDLAIAIAGVVGAPPDFFKHDIDRPGDVHHLCAATGKAKKLLGFEAKVGLSAGLGALHDWYRSAAVDPAGLVAEQKTYNWEI